MKKSLSTIIEITDSHVKLLQSKIVRGRRVISLCDVRKILNPTDEEIAKIIKDITFSKNIVSDDLNFVFPRRLVILKRMKLPSQQDAEIRKMAGLQLVNQIPYALEDVVYDVQIIDKDPSGYSNVLVFVVHKELCNKYLGMLNDIHIRVSKMTVSSMGILSWLSFEAEKKLVELKQPMMVLNVDSENSELCFCSDGKLLYSRNLTFGVKDIVAENMIGLLEQIELSLGIYRKEDMGLEVKKVIILSPLPEILAFSSRLEQEIKIPVQSFSSLENVLCQKNLKLASLKDQAGVSLAAGLGFLLSDDPKRINLTPQEVHDIKKIQTQKQQWAKFSALVIIAIIVGSGIFFVDFYKKSILVNDLEKSLKDLDPKIKASKQKMAFIDFYNHELKNRVDVAELVHALFELAPAEISFRSLQLDDRGNFTLEGYSKTSSGVNNFQSNLVKSPLFKKVSLQFATKRKIVKMELTDFKIVAELKKTEP